MAFHSTQLKLRVKTLQLLSFMSVLYGTWPIILSPCRPKSDSNTLARSLHFKPWRRAKLLTRNVCPYMAPYNISHSSIRMAVLHFLLSPPSSQNFPMIMHATMFQKPFWTAFIGGSPFYPTHHAPTPCYHAASSIQMYGWMHLQAGESVLS